MNSKKLYLLLLLVIPLLIVVIKPTYSKFTETITTEEDIVNLNTNLNINMTNLEEYKTIIIGSKDYEIFDIELTNNINEKVFYSVWYKLIEQSTINDNIIIAKLINENAKTQGELEVSETITISLIIKNNTNNQIKLNIGASTSNNSIEEIEYSDGREPITKEVSETDIYYDDITNKYYLGATNTEFTFKTESIIYNANDNYQTFTAPYSGYYQIGLWAPTTTNQSGDQLSTNLYLNKNSSIYFYVGKTSSDSIYNETDVRLISGPWNKEESLNSRILIAGNDINQTYTYEDEIADDSYNLNNNLKQNLKSLKNTIKTSKTNFGNGKATIQYLINQEPTVDGIKYVKYGQNYKIEDIKCNNNGKGCQIVKVRPSITKNLEIGTYEIVYIVKDNDNTTYKYTSTFEVISE